MLDWWDALYISFPSRREIAILSNHNAIYRNVKWRFLTALHQEPAGRVFGKKCWGALLGDPATSLTSKELHLAWVGRDFRYKLVYFLCCLWPTVALTVYTRSLHAWPRLLWSPCSGTFLLPLKSFVPSPSYPESFMLRTGSPAIALGTWRHYLQSGLCTLQKQSEPEALLGGAVWERWSVCRGQGDLAKSSLSLHSNLSHIAWRSPRSELPHEQWADIRSSLHLRFNLRTFLQWADVLLIPLQEPRVTGPLHTLELHICSQMDNLCESPLGCCMLLTGYFGNYDSTSMYKIRWF